MEKEIDKIAKLLLEGKSCKNCKYIYSPDKHCKYDKENQHFKYKVCVNWKTIPEIDMNIKSYSVNTKTRKLKAQWSKESELRLNSNFEKDFLEMATNELKSNLDKYIMQNILKKKYNNPITILEKNKDIKWKK